MNGRLSYYLREEKLPCLYTDDLYIKAAQIFSLLRQDKEIKDGGLSETRRRPNERTTVGETKSVLPHFESATDKFLAYDLAYITLEYQRLLEDLIADVGFLAQYPELLDVEALAIVMLGDYQRRKFQPRPRPPTGGASEETSAVSCAVESCSLRLNAALARRRIRCDARSIEEMLPSRSKAKALQQVKQPSCAWINQIMTSKSEVIDLLTDGGYLPVKGVDSLLGRTFLIDSSRNDVIAFAPDMKDDLRNHDLVKRRYIVLQEYTSCLGSRALTDVLCSNYDVIHVDSGNGAATAHISSLMKERGVTGNILRFTTSEDASGPAIAERLMQDLGVANVQVFSEKFGDVPPDDPRFKYVRTALLTAACTGSAVANPIDFLVTDGGDISILKNFSAEKASAALARDAANRNQILLKHAMSVPSMKAVVYLTRSTNTVENENVVLKTLDLVNADQPPKRAYRPVPFYGPTRLTSAETSPTSDAYYKLAPTPHNNGCFVAVLSREMEDAPARRTNKDKPARTAATLNATAELAAASTGATPTSGKPAKTSKKKLRKAQVAFGRLTSASRSRKKK